MASIKLHAVSAGVSEQGAKILRAIQDMTKSVSAQMHDLALQALAAGHTVEVRADHRNSTVYTPEGNTHEVTWVVELVQSAWDDPEPSLRIVSRPVGDTGVAKPREDEVE